MKPRPRSKRIPTTSKAQHKPNTELMSTTAKKQADVTIEIINEKNNYTAKKEFAQLKQYRAVAAHRIEKQNELLNKVSRGKFRVKEIPKDVLYALVKHDKELLEKAVIEFEERTSQLRQKSHEEILECNQ